MVKINLKELKQENDELKKQLNSSKKQVTLLNEHLDSLSKKFGKATTKIKSLEGRLSTSERKRKSLMEEKKKNSGYLPLTPIKRHKYNEFIVTLCVQLYVNAGCSFRGVVAVVNILKGLLKWDIAVPCLNEIRNWVIKAGYSIYKESDKEITKGKYAAIVDDSMMVGSQRLLLIMGSKSKHQGKPLSHNDVEVLGMSVSRSWDGDGICTELEKVSKQAHCPPTHVTSDNASIMKKGIFKSKLLHIRDISHTLGMLMERIYKKDKMFTSFMKKLSQVKQKYVMKPEAYLLPPKQRDISRFLNLSQVVDWSSKILKNFKTKLLPEERKIFTFILKYALFINELQTVLSCINVIEKKIKNEGLSQKSVKFCMKYIQQNLSTGNERMEKLAESIGKYLKEEVSKLPSSNTCWHASSDVVESMFGVYKDRKSPNPLHGVTPLIFLLPLHTRIGTKDGMLFFDFKHGLESVFMREIEVWRKENLLENQVNKRIKKLKIA
jgi:hypothetical protein